MMKTKKEYIQIRVTAAQKKAIRQRAGRAGSGMSRWILDRLLPDHTDNFSTILKNLEKGRDRSFVLAELNDLLTRLTPHEYHRAVAELPAGIRLSAADANYVAAMVELAAGRHGTDPPAWTRTISPDETPIFGTGLQGVRLHLLLHSPLPFRKRNIFIDASLGDRV